MFAARRVLGASSLAARQLSSSSGRLATTPRVPYKKPADVAPKTVARAAASTAGRGNPDVVETPLSTANEIDVENSRGEPTGPFAGEALPEAPGDATTDWSTSYQGLSVQPFSKETAEILMAPIEPMDVEIKPDGLLYLPEIKYRRILNRAFGPGGWGLAPRSGINVSPKTVSREFALVCLGRLVAIARGEQEYFDPEGVATATEAAKSNALMRCCKDLGIASELWDPRFIREFKAKYCIEVFVEHATNKNKKKLWRRKDQPKFEYPWKENTSTFAR